MRYLAMHYSDDATESGVPPSPDVIAGVGRYMEETAQSGVLLAAEGVRPSSMGARLTRDDGGKVTVKDGPFAEAKELIAGFAILDVKSKEEAIEHAKRFADIVGAPQVDVRLIAEF